MGMVETYKEAIERLSDKGLNAKLDGLKLMGKMMGEGLFDLSMCPGVRDSVKDLSARLLELLNPINFARIAGKNIAFHSFAVVDHIHKGLSAEKKGNAYEFGRQIGIAISILIG